MKWNKRSRWKAIRKVAEQSEVISLDLEKYARPGFRLNTVVRDKKLILTFDLTLPITPQIEQADAIARWRQSDLGFKMKRATTPMSDEDFEQGLDVVTMYSEGSSFQQIGDSLWSRDSTAEGRKSKAYRTYRQMLASHSIPYFKIVRISS